MSMVGYVLGYVELDRVFGILPPQCRQTHTIECQTD